MIFHIISGNQNVLPILPETYLWDISGKRKHEI